MSTRIMLVTSLRWRVPRRWSRGSGWSRASLEQRDHDDDRAAAPVEAQLVRERPGGGRGERRLDLGQPEGALARQQRLDVPADDVGDLAERVLQVLGADRLVGAHAQQGAGQLVRGGGVGGDGGATGELAVHVHPGGQGLRGGGHLALPGAEVAGLPVDHRGEHLVLLHGGGGHTGSSAGTSPSRSSLSRMASVVNGLIRYSWAPAASARTIWPCSLSVVTIISVMVRQAGLARTRVTKVRPSITGMFQSMQARSTSSPDSSRSSACCPSPAWTVLNPRFSSAPATMRRIVRESSMTSALIASLLVRMPVRQGASARWAGWWQVGAGPARSSWGPRRRARGVPSPGPRGWRR